jgi:hypothetical protein
MSHVPARGLVGLGLAGLEPPPHPEAIAKITAINSNINFFILHSPARYFLNSDTSMHL